ncbi:nucleotidyltransferase [Aggregatibacter actinomycetemcomitans]|uniref:nucleotidyltransferase family protein n=1 Tax=Aggregatibacter actinomycetemcomitans TaxID=714 RepID=UPI001DF98D3A|nr:nucleotidyltransferase [Aggregatibacter actinomycetemcomitans]MBN6074474.1 nucleotidyltransferase [Aggregatibacter actinomycetemcomitans]
MLSVWFHFSNPRIFGSVLAQQDTEQSDLDLLVEPSVKTTLFDYCDLKEELETLLGIKVPCSLPEKFRDNILQTAQPI